MVNLKKKVYAALKEIHDNVSDSWPQDWQGEEMLVYTEEDNRSYERSGTKTTKSYCRYRIDILGQRSLSDMAALVDSVLAYDEEGTGLGFTRTLCQDDNSGQNRHKIMRYECVVSEKDGTIYGIS